MLKGKLENYLPSNEKIKGIYRGVVEDVNDPLKAWRVRVRIYGIHTEDKIIFPDHGVPTDTLVWAEPCLAPFGGISHAGLFSLPLLGSHVFVFFENGNHMNPRYFASVPGIPQAGTNPDYTGFKDPTKTFPKTDELSKPDISPLARCDKNPKIVTDKNDNRILDIDSVSGETWDEPESPYNPEYSKNSVISTHDDILIELDSTDNNKRFHIYHPSGTYIEIDNDGNLVIKNTNNSYNISENDKYEYIGNDKTVSIENDFKLKVKGNIIIECDNDIDISGNNINMTASTNINMTATRIDLNKG